MLSCSFFFFFKQKTAYEMRISDWSSDVCSSDLVALPADFAEVEAAGLLLPDLLTTGRVRHWLDRLPTPDIERFLAHAGEPELIAAMVRYSFLDRKSVV